MKRLIILSFFTILSCTNDTQRIAMECYVYDSMTKTPVKNVEVTQLLDGENAIIAVTSSKGYFKVDKLSKLKIGMESHNLASLILLKKQGYLTDTIEVYGGINDLYKKDSIFIDRKK